MTRAIPAAWPARRGMPDLAALDEPTRRKVADAVELLRTSQAVFADRFLALARLHLPEYGVLTDEEIRATAQQFMDTLIAELSSLRVPDAALRGLLGAHAAERTSRGIPPEVLAAGYQLGSRAMLAVLDEVAVEVGLPPELVLAMHDSTWEFSNEAASVFARVQRDLALERAYFDAERRSAFAGGVLGGTLPGDHINRDAPLFGLDTRARHVPLAARAASPAEAEAIRRAIASALRMPADRLLFAEVGGCLGFIAAGSIEQLAGQLAGHLVAAGTADALERLHDGFAEAVLALETAARFRQSGLVRLADLGPRPLVLTAARVAAGLSARHLTGLAGAGRANRDIEETVRVYLECDQQVRDAAERLAVHRNTVRYRVHRFHELTGLDLRRTEDLVTAWWLLNRRRPAAGG
ncbi:helix-turn-helix domain-containing protein [Actinoplanes sp. NPDC026623]|uniref:PucR family transcriptional regulator n=1 Tax=Actinoplanes sp. NPDC026623 TaxID=3155610 RepID=UPI0033F8774C